MTPSVLGIKPRQGLLAVAAGLLGAAAFWPISAWPPMLVSVCLFLRLLRDQGVQAARNIGLVYGLAFAAVTMYWMILIFGARAVLLLMFMAAYFGLLSTLVALTRGYIVLARACLIALFAVAIEWLRGDAWYLSFPWYTPAHALAAAPPMVAGAHWLGTYGLSFVIWLLAAAGAFRPWVYAGFVLLPAFWLLLPDVGEPDCRVVLIQTEHGGIEPLIAAVPDEKADLCVLPEYAYTCSPESALSEPDGPAALARKTGSPVVFGAVEGTYGKMPFNNVAAVIDADGRLLGTFPKQRPVPLMLDGTPGDRRPVFPVDRGGVGGSDLLRLRRPGGVVVAAPFGGDGAGGPDDGRDALGPGRARAPRPSLQAPGGGERPLARPRQFIGAFEGHQPARGPV